MSDSQESQASQEEELNERLGWAGLGVLVVVTSLALAGLLLRARYTWRLDSRQRRLSVSTTDTSSGGFQSFPPPPPPSAARWSDLLSCPRTPVSTASTVSYYLDQWSVEEILNTTLSVLNYINHTTLLSFYLYKMFKAQLEKVRNPSGCSRRRWRRIISL